MAVNQYDQLVDLKFSVGDNDIFMQLLNTKELGADMNLDETWLESLPEFKDPPLNYANSVPANQITEQADKAVALMAGVAMDDQTKDMLKKEIIEKEGHLFPNDLSPPPRTDQQIYDDSLKSGQKVFSAIGALLSPLTAADKQLRDVKKDMNDEFYHWLYKKQVKTRIRSEDNKEEEVVTISGYFGSKFKQMFDTKEGRIVAENVYQKQYGRRDALSWSDLAFYYFKEQIEKEDGQVSSLKEIKQETISNKQTLTTMSHCYAARGVPQTTRMVWTPADGNIFLALLGTPNGRGAGWLLADHNDEMGYLQIVSIETEIKGPYDGYMWVRYGKAERQ